MRSPLLPLSAALLLLCNLAGVALLKDFHYKLHLFNYKARSPTLALCSGVASLVVIDVALVDTLLRSAGGRPLPLPVMLWVSWLSLPLYFLPYLLRMVKVRVVFSPTLRAKYSKFVGDKRLFTIIAMAACVACVAAALSTVFWDSYSKLALCHSHDTIWLFEDMIVEALIVLMTALVAWLAAKCPEVEAVFDLRFEIGLSCCAWIALGGTYVALRRLAPAPNPATDVVAVAALALMQAAPFAATFAAPFQSKHLLRNPSGSRESISRAIISASEKGDFDGSSAGPRKSIRGWDPEEIFEHPQMVEILMDVASKHRCAEIVAFALAAQAHSRRHPSSAPDRLFAEYMQLVNTYIAPQSKQEINISQGSRDRLMEYTSKPKFTALSGAQRVQLFSSAYKEALQIIQMNLMVPFATHSRLKALECEQRETLNLERSLTEAGLVDIRQADLTFALEL